MRARPTSRLVIEPMRRGDVDAIMEIERAGIGTPWDREIFVEELRRDFAHVDVLRERGADGERVLAFINYWLVRDEVHVLNVATSPAVRRQGHGSRLLEHAIQFAHEHDCRYVTLEARRSNHGAIRLYRKHGFRPVGIRPHYYADNNEDAVVMLLDLS
jgi:ribosomal-protein-alanine N-acetyltransferase